MGSLELSGSVIRDRTWGWRQDIAAWTEYYASFFSFDDFDLAVMKFCTPDGDVPAHGALVGSRTGTVVASEILRLQLSLAKPEARVFCTLNDPKGPAALTAYDDLVEIRTGDGAVGFGIMEQGILRRQA